MNLFIIYDRFRNVLRFSKDLFKGLQLGVSHSALAMPVFQGLCFGTYTHHNVDTWAASPLN